MYYANPTEGFFPIAKDAFEESLKSIDYTVTWRGEWVAYRDRHSGQTFAMQHDTSKDTVGREPFFKTQ